MANKVMKHLLNWLGVTLMTVGALATVLALTPAEVLPEPMQAPVEFAKQEVSRVVDEAQHAAVAGEVKTITLGRIGGDYELDLCDGTFTNFPEYEEAGLKPLWLAHNGCGGSIVLYMELGEVINVVELDGTTRAYTIVEERNLNKDYETAAALEGMSGDMVIQTCYWSSRDMRFLSLEKVLTPEEQKAAAAEKLAEETSEKGAVPATT